MSACAYIQFNTSFTEELLPYLEYSENIYSKCTLETFVTGGIFSTLGRFAAVELAEIFNVDMADASTWNIPPTFKLDEMKIASLHALFQDDVTPVIEVFNMLLNNPKSRLAYNLSS